MNELITSELISIQNIKVAMFFFCQQLPFENDSFLYLTLSKRWHLTINCSIWAPITYWAHAYLRYILRNPCGVPNIFFRQLWLKDHLKLVKKHVLVVIECFFFLMFVLLMEQLVRNITVMSCHLSKMWNLEECSSVFCRFLMCLETMKLGNSKTDKDSGYIPSPWQVCVFFIYLFFFVGEH